MAFAPPPGYSTLSPYLVCPEPDLLMAFAESAFGARRRGQPLRHRDGRVMHAELLFGDTVVMVGCPEGAGTTVTAMLHVYVDDCDAAYRAALAAGAEPVTEPENQPDGDRRAGVRDRFGNLWYVGQAGAC